MKEYIASNKRKIIFQLKWTSVILAAIWIVYVLVQCNNGNIINLITFILGLIAATILLPLLVEFLVASKEFIAFNRYNKILNAEPFNQLTKLGFTKTYTDKKSNWATSMPTFVGQLENYPMRIEVENGNVRVIVDVDLDKVEKEHMTELKLYFGDKNIKYDWFGLALIYKPSIHKDLSIQAIESDIKQFIKFLKNKKLDCWKINNN